MPDPGADDPASRVRVLIVSHNYPRFAGDPAGAFVARLAEAGAAAGHDVRVIAPHAPGLPRTAAEGGVSVERVRYAPDFLERVAYRGDLHHAGARRPLVALGVPMLFAAIRRAVRRAVERGGVDVVHAHWWIPAGLLAARLRAPLVITCHGSDVRLLDRSRLARRLARRAFAAAAAVTAVSRFLAEDLERLIPELRGRVLVTPMPVDVAMFEGGAGVPRAEPPRILYAGNLLRSKGVHTLIEAVHRLVVRGERCQLRVVGEGPAREELESLVRARHLEKVVEWRPFQPQTAMPAEYGSSTVVVLPTHGQAEGLGLTLVEALLAGSAVVGTPAGGIPEVVVHEQTGLIARDDDPDALAAAIGRLLRDPALRARLTEAGRTRVRQRHGQDASVARFLDVYHDVRDDTTTR